MRRVLSAIVVGCVLAGCGGEPTARSEATATPTATATATPEGRFDIAYKLPRSVARRLHEERNAYEVIEEEGEVIARSDFGEETAYPLADWLEKRGIVVSDPHDLARMWVTVDRQQSLYLMVMTSDEKIADALDELRPSKRRLAAVYNRWSETVPGGAAAMTDWLRIFELAIREGDERDVVIIPIQH